MTNTIDNFRNPEDDFQPALSPAGRRRREQILQMAQGAAHQRRIRRRIIAIAPIAIFAALSVSLFTAQFRRLNSTHPIVDTQGPFVPVAITPSARQATPIQVTWIATEPGIAERLAVPTQPPVWKSLSDGELVQDLADVGKPVGLAYADGRPIVVVDGRPLN